MSGTGPVRPITRAGFTGEVVAELAAPDLEDFLDDPDAFMVHAIQLKDDPPSHVVRTHLAGRDLVIKRFRHPDPWRALRRLPRPSRAVGSWRGSALLQELGLRVPEPLGWIERRRGPLRLASWWLSAFVEGREAPEVLAEAPADERAVLIDRLAVVVACMQNAHIAHDDLKATNFLLSPDSAVHLLDLHAVRRVRPGARALRRDLARFLRNFSGDPELQERVREALRAHLTDAARIA